MRSFLFSCSFYVLTLVCAVLLLVTLPLPGRKPVTKGIHLWTCAVLWLLRVIGGVHIRIDGRENLLHGKAVIVVSKHMSDLDPIVFFNLRPDMTALAKKELFRIPIIGLLLHKLNIVRIDRQSGTAHLAMDNVVADIQADRRALVVYPEGTRTRVGEQRKLKSGAFYLQLDGTIPAIPVATNSGLHWPKGLVRTVPGTVVYEIGTPLRHETEKAVFMEEVHKRVIARSDYLMQADHVWKDASLS